jgi:hypothetical protein
MATTKSLASLEKSKEAVSVIKKKLLPVLKQLTDDKFGEATGRARASVALSLGMMRYMGTRLRGLDQGRKSDDPLRKDLNNIKRVLASATKKHKAASSAHKTNMETSTKMSTKSADGKTANSHAVGSSNLYAKKSEKVEPKETGSKVQKEEEAATCREETNRKKKRKTEFNVSAKTINRFESKKSRKK